MAGPKRSSEARSAKGARVSADLAALRATLGALVQRRLGDVSLLHGAPAAAPVQRSIGLYLFEFAPAAAPSKQERGLQFNARFLVTAWAADETQAADDLAELVFAALDEGEFEIDLQPLSAATWAAFGVVPRPSFTLSSPVRRLRVRRPAPPVRETVLRLTAQTVPLRGVLLEQDETPLAGVRIELPALRRAALTDAQGRFEFASVPVGSALRLLARARGVDAVFDIEIEAGAASSLFFPLHISLLQAQP